MNGLIQHLATSNILSQENFIASLVGSTNSDVILRTDSWLPKTYYFLMMASYKIATYPVYMQRIKKYKVEWTAYRTITSCTPVETILDVNTTNQAVSPSDRVEFLEKIDIAQRTYSIVANRIDGTTFYRVTPCILFLKS